MVEELVVKDEAAAQPDRAFAHVGGFFAYYAVPTNYAALGDFRAQVIWLWLRARGQNQ